MIVAEIGVNHNGSVELALKLIDEAIKCKVDAVKFQIFHTELLSSSSAMMAKYQGDGKQSDMLKELELSNVDFIKIKKYCDNRKIIFIATPFDIESVDFLVSLNVQYIKVGSGDITNYLLLNKIAKTKLKVILSTGMSNLNEIASALNILREREVILLQCVSSYPTSDSSINLQCISTLRSVFNRPVGLSDHTTSLDAGMIAYVLGAVYIEKHFTLDVNMKGPDHKASLCPFEMKIYVVNINRVKKLLGSGTKECLMIEEDIKNASRRSMAVNKDKLAGDVIYYEDLISLRPNNGIPANNMEIIGMKLKKNIDKFNILMYDDLLLEQSGNVILVGTGYMAKEYAKALLKIGKRFIVIGNTEGHCKEFSNYFGDNIIVIANGYENFFGMAEHIIIASPIELLEEHIRHSIAIGIDNILVEKPGGLNVNILEGFIKSNKNIRIGYNRRCYASVMKLKEIIRDDRITSFKFDITEIIDKIDFKKFKKDILNKWGFSMTSHLIDLAFYLGGRPKFISSLIQGGLSWHDSSIFVGVGETLDGILFSYHGNWGSVGRWKLELCTNNGLFILCPLEKLQMIRRGSLTPEDVIIDISNEVDIKPGILIQTKLFMEKSNELLTLKEQCNNLRDYMKIFGYKE